MKDNGMRPRQFCKVFILVCTMSMLPGLVSGRGDDATLAKRHFSLAVQNKNSGNYEEAERQFRKSLSFCDTIYNIHYSYGDLLVKMERPGEALDSFRKSLSLNPEHYNSAAMLARLYYQEADYDSALVLYEYMNELKPGDNKVLASVAGLSEYLGHDEEAFESYVRLIEAGEDSYNNLIRASRLALKGGDLDTARTFAVMALEKQPDDIDALTIAGETSSALNELETAGVYYRRLVEIDSLSIETVTTLENIYRTVSDRPNLIWALEQHHGLAPKDVEVIGELAELLYSESLMDRAITYVQKGLELDPDDGRFHILLGENYRSLGQMDKALAEFKIAMKDPEWKSSAQRLVWQIEKPETEEEKREREFFSRGKESQ